MKGGIIVSIIDGKSKGKFGELPHDKQADEFTRFKRAFIRFYHDEQCAHPVLHEVTGKPTVGLISIHFIKKIGLYD